MRSRNLGFSSRIHKKKEREDMRDKKPARSGHALSTKNGRRVRAFDRRGEYLCVVTFLIPLLLLLFYGDDERAFSNFFGFRIPSFVCFSSPNTKNKVLLTYILSLSFATMMKTMKTMKIYRSWSTTKWMRTEVCPKRRTPSINFACDSGRTKCPRRKGKIL